MMTLMKSNKKILEENNIDIEDETEEITDEDNSGESGMETSSKGVRWNSGIEN